jgi:acetyl esterase
MYISEAMRIILERAKANPAPDYPNMPINEARVTFLKLASYWNQNPQAVFEAKDILIQTPDCALPARLYQPFEASPQDAVLIYVHGGGWTFGSVESHDAAVRRLALACGFAVLSIDYRLAPEHAFPAGHNDLMETIGFVENGGLGRHVPAAQIALAGDSAGANLALGALLARYIRGLPQLATAALFYGCYAPDHETASHRRFGDGSFLLSTERMKWFWGNFLGTEALHDPGLAAPLYASDDALAGLPPLYLNAAGLDPLLDDSLLLSTRLAHVGVPMRFDLFPGVVHGFQQMGNELPAAREAFEKAGQWLKHYCLKGAS